MSRWRRTMSATAALSSCWNAASSVLSPSARARFAAISASGRGRLPTWLVRMRSALRRIGPFRLMARRVLSQERLDARLCRGQRRLGLPLPDELATGDQPRQFVGDRPGVRLVVAGEDEARRLDGPGELAVGAIDKAGRIKVLVEGVKHLLSRLGAIAERLGPALEVGVPPGSHRADPADRLGQDGG